MPELSPDYFKPAPRRGRSRGRGRAARRALPSKGHAGDDRLGELRPARCARMSGQRAHEQVRRGLSRTALLRRLRVGRHLRAVGDRSRRRSCSAPSTRNVQPHAGAQVQHRRLPRAAHARGHDHGSLARSRRASLAWHEDQRVGRLYEIAPYEVARESSLIDMDEVARIARERRPQAFARRLVGLPAPTRLRALPRDRRRGRGAADGRPWRTSPASSRRACTPTPSSSAPDVVTTTTHKTLGGPRAWDHPLQGGAREKRSTPPCSPASRAARSST